jgi:hypothetical protein
MIRFSSPLGDLRAWAKRLVDDLNKYLGQETPGPFADDPAAEAGGVAVGSLYRVDDGSVAWRQA